MKSEWLVLLPKVAVAVANFLGGLLLVSTMKLCLQTEDAFRYPLFLSALHQLFIWASTGAYMQWKTRRDAAQNLSPSSSSSVPISVYVGTIFPVAFCGAISIGCANTALMYIYPSLHEMIQGLTPLWVIFLGKIFTPQKRHNLQTYVSLIPILLGGVLCVHGEVGELSSIGLVASMLAVVARVLRMIAQERVFHGATNDACRKLDSVSLLFRTAPLNCVLFFLFSLAYEDLLGFSSATEFSQLRVYAFLSLRMHRSTYWYFLLSGFTACFFNISSFLQVEMLGTLIPSLITQLKTPSSIITSWLLFGNVCTPLQWLGSFLVCIGLLYFQRYGKSELQPVLASNAASSRSGVWRFIRVAVVLIILALSLMNLHDQF
mmetsp:Transcript_22094/g.58482  ORF Transcript_22094/g.58482 Transcript_22094/m.58482 type:complete len:375 (-) Transcript_22094:14-1138(-)